jgi:uncharacterized protein (DUF2062 family)
LKLPQEIQQTRQLKWYSSPRQLLRTILMQDDTAHSIALGTTVGMFIGMTPTVGVQMILVMLFAYVVSPFLRFNRAAALVTVYISNPLTVVPLYWFCYKVGTLFVSVGGLLTPEDFSRILQYNNFQEWSETVVALFVHVGKPLILGSLLVASVCALVTYPMMHWLLRRFQKQQAT